jgi:hypothetical protein
VPRVIPGLRQIRLGLERLRDAEVHDLDGAVVGDADVGGLDVAMDDLPLVRVVEPVGNRHEDLDLPDHGDGLGPLDLLVEVLAGQELLDDVGDVVLDSEVVDRRDVPVVEISGQLRLHGRSGS